MEGSEDFTDIVFSWSLEDILNENLYKHQAVGCPESIESDIQERFASYKYPLLEDTRAQMQCRLENMYRAPFGKVISIQESNPHGTPQYYVKVDSWRNSVSKKEETMPGDVFILVDAKAECVSDLQKEGRSWMFLIAVEAKGVDDTHDSTSLHFKARASKQFDVNNGIAESLFVIYLENIAPNIRIYKAMHMCTSARWRVIFSEKFLKSFKQLKLFRTKMTILSLLLKLSTGWRSKKSNANLVCRSSSMILKKFKVEGLFIVCSTDVVKGLGYMQVLKVWDIVPDLCSIETLVNHLDCFFVRHTDGFIKLCCVKYFEGDLEVPMSWPASLDVIRYKDLGVPNDLVDNVSEDEIYVENSKVSESLLLMKFYSLSSGVVNHLLSDREGRELVLPFEVTDEQMEAILYNKSTFIVGRSGTGKSTIVTMKLYQKEQYFNMAKEGLYDVEQSPGGSNATALRQIFVTVSPRLCYATKQHVSNLRSFASGVSCHSEFGSIGLDGYDDAEAEFSDLPSSFSDIPSNCYPLFITFHKFLMMLDGTLGNSYFERFLRNLNLPQGPLQSLRSTALKSFLRTKEVNFERFCSSYWPHFNLKLTKQLKLDALRVFTEIISHIKGGLGALEAADGKLSRYDYVQMSKRRASTLCQTERETIYNLYQAYEKMKTRNGEFDITDFVIDIHRRLRRENYKGDEIDFVYIDEVQDLTMSQIMLFKHICRNVEEGFVFSGDTAQTISKGVDFRFQEIRHLFYNKFVLESRCDQHNRRKEKAIISKNIHLTQNFRTHDRVLRLSQSIIDLLYHFFPGSIDRLKPETSPIQGEDPVLLQSGENEDMIIQLFGSSATSFVGFGAEQVILVRDASARKGIFKSVGKQVLVLTIMECKGLEFEDVLLYNYFGSSPSLNEWGLMYNYMKEHDLLGCTLSKPIPTFDGAKHNVLCSELKQLYVAVSRTRKRLWIYENTSWNPMLDYWIKKSLVQVKQLDDSLVEKMKVSSGAEEWKSRGIKLYHERNYDMATMCFQKAQDTYWERKSKAGGLIVIAYSMQTANPETAKSILREAAEIFEEIQMPSSAAQCFFDSGDYEIAGRIYYQKCGTQARERAAECFFLAKRYEFAAEIFQSIGKADSTARCYYKLRKYERAGTIYLEDCSELGLAGKCFFKAGCYETAAKTYARGNLLSNCLTACLKGKLFELGLESIESWKQHARKEHDLAIRGKLEFLESCAFHYYKVEDTRSKMKSVRSEMLSSQKILNGHLSSDSSRYLWDDKLIRDFHNLQNYSEVKQSEKLFSVDSLVYFWNVWKGTLVYLIEYFKTVEKSTFGDFFLNYLGVWRQFHDDLDLLYTVLISDADWVRGRMEKRSFLSNGELVTVDVWQIISAVHSYWTSKLLSFSIRILKKLEKLYRSKPDSEFCQSWCLTQMYAVAKGLLESKYLKLRNEDIFTLQSFVEISTEGIFACRFLPDWRKSVLENMVSLEQRDTTEYFKTVENSTCGDFFLNYLGVWRQFHDDLDLLYTVLISDADWVRGRMEKRSFLSNGELVTVDVWQIISAVHSYWTSKLLSFSIRILKKLEKLYRSKPDSEFCQSWCLTLMYAVAKGLLESKYLKLRNEDIFTLQSFVEISTEGIFACIFLPDWRKSVLENMVSLRQRDTTGSLLKQVLLDYTISNGRLSYGQVGRLVMIILGSGNFEDDKLYEKLLKNLECSPPWKVFIQNLCQSMIAKPKGSVLINTSQENKDVSLVHDFHQALAETYYANWREVDDYISPDGFFYLIECLLMWVSCFQGFVVTTKSCFIEWLMQKEDTIITSSILADVRISFELILKFLIDVVREVLYEKETMVEWIQRSISKWEEYHSLLILRSVVILCLLYLNFGMGYDVLLDLLWREDITEQLPKDFCNALRRIVLVQSSHNENVNVLAKALKEIGNDMVVASFGVDCSRFFCSDSIFVKMKAYRCRDEILRLLFQRPHICAQYSHGQTIMGESCSPVSSAYDSEETIIPTHLLPTPDEVHHTDSNKSDNPMGFDAYALWDKFESFKLAEKDDQRSFLTDAKAVKLFVGKIIFLLTAEWSTIYSNAVDKEEQKVSREVLNMLDELVQLYAVLHVSEEELGNKMSTIAELSAKLQARRQTMEPVFFWPEKRELIYAQQFPKHSTKSDANASGNVVESK